MANVKPGSDLRDRMLAIRARRAHRGATSTEPPRTIPVRMAESIRGSLRVEGYEVTTRQILAVARNFLAEREEKGRPAPAA